MSVTGTTGAPPGVEQEDDRRAIVELLIRAYWMEIETVMNYLAASISQDGARAAAVRAALAQGIDEEVEHTRALGRRILELNRVLPGEHGLARGAGGGEYPQAPDRPVDVRAIIESVVATELSAIRLYTRIMRATVAIDKDTNALARDILRDERRHLRVFEGYLRDWRPTAADLDRARPEER
jgi:bacterioferritin